MRDLLQSLPKSGRPRAADSGGQPAHAHRFFLRLLLVLGLGCLFADPGAAQPCGEWSVRVVSVQGVVQARRAGETQWEMVGLDQTFCPGDLIRTGQNSRAAILLPNEAVIRLDEKTTVTFTADTQERAFFLNLLHGAAHFFSRFPRKLKVVTPFVDAAVEGTEFYLRAERDQTVVTVFEGRVLATNPRGRLVLTEGQSTMARADQAPALQIPARPRDAVQWALYYPPIIDWRQADFEGAPESDWRAMVRASIGYYWEGDLAAAFAALSQAPPEVRDPRFYAYRAALRLTVGRVDAAQTDIERALSLDSTDSHSVALQSIVAAVQNDRDHALELAQKSVALDPGSAAAAVALSYAQQSRFDIEGAANSLRRAVQLDPSNALAWARYAELLLATAELDKATAAAKRAVSLNPDLARAQTVLGFAFITRIQIEQAKDAFRKAIRLDSAAPLPRLGLGLAAIRGGDLKGGRREIEVAASLDPNNALIRSYLGKAYHDEKRDQSARDQFDIAKRLDPKDPTPWFYDAIREQTVNRPVVALHNMQKAIELNDNRGVYRSRLLLDEDLAARSAALGRIYDDLGFQQIALLAGWKSLNADPSNYSAHRLLADLYSGFPRLDIARASELLQSQLLQPLNVTPVQPQISQTNLFILDGSGPARPSFNEFHPLFLRNRLALQVSGVVGNHDTLGDELAQSGVWGRYSYSLGQFHYKTDGYRDNNDLEDDIYDALVQVSLSPKVSVQAEYRHRDLDHGDLSFRYDLDAPDTSFSRDVRTDNLRAGFHWATAPHSDIIASVIYQDAREQQDQVLQLDTGFGFTIDVPISARLNTDGYIAEGQYLFRRPAFNLITGAGHYNADNSLKLSGPSDDFDTQQSNGYLYSHLRYPARLLWTIGASYDYLDDDLLGDTRRFNPKLGLTFDLTDRTTLRFAFFKVLKRNLFADQTLEPTQVAGFNQFFDDINGTRSTLYGGAVDHAFSENLTTGLAYSLRQLRVPRVGDPVQTETWDEDLIRAYLYWTISQELAFSLEHQYEHFDRDVKSASDTPPKRTKTHWLAATLGYFHPSGLFGRCRTSYVNQHVKFVTNGNEDDQFALVDLAVGYRLPRRYGVLSFGVANLFDKNFRYQGLDSRTSQQDVSVPPFLPERSAVLQMTLSF